MKRSIIWILCISMLGLGCSSNQYKSTADVNAIENENRLATSKNIAFSVRDPSYQIVLDENDRIFGICTIGQRCDGQLDANHDVIELSATGIGLGGKPVQHSVCGTGLFVGHVKDEALTYPKDERACNSRFYKTSDRFVGLRILGILTFGLIDLELWNLHKKSFDIQSLDDAVYKAHLPELQALLFKSEKESKSSGALSVVYINTDDIDSTYNKITSKSVTGDSVVLIDEDTQKPLYVLRLNDFKDKELPVAVNLQLDDFISSLAASAAVNPSVTGLDVKKMIPAEVSLPAMPPVPQLTKSEYETKQVFNERVEKAVSEREDAIRSLQQQYKRSVQNRNQYIEALGVAWQQYLDGKATEQSDIVKKLKKNQASLARLLYAMNLGKFTASDISYDAEGKSLYFIASSARYGFKQKMLAKVSASSARSIKESGKYLLKPELLIKNDKVQMKGLTLTETTGADNYATSYTDVNFKPEAVSVKVATSSNKINKELSAIFKSYEQKPQAIVDANAKEIWYIETVNRINARMPDWYAVPVPSKNIVGYGEGNSHEEAMHSARKELAFALKTTISASTEILQKDNTFRSYNDVTQRVSATTDVEFKDGDFSVYKQAELDGKYYVALCYRCLTN